MVKPYDLFPSGDSFGEKWMMETVAKALSFYADLWQPLNREERTMIADLADMYALIAEAEKTRDEAIKLVEGWFDEK